MFNPFKTKPLLDDFYQQNKIGAEKEPLLNIGAMLLEYNQYRDSLTLKSRLKPGQLEPLLNDAWGVFDKSSCQGLLEGLLQLPNQTEHSDYVNALLLQHRNINELAYEVLIEPANLYGCLERNCESLFRANGTSFDRIQFDAIGNVTAWDIERGGLVTRYAFNIGWLTQEEAMGYLEKFYALAKANYSKWADYYIAYMKSRTLFYEQKETDYIEYVYTLHRMYRKPEYFCLQFPLHEQGSEKADR